MSPCRFTIVGFTLMCIMIGCDKPESKPELQPEKHPELTRTPASISSKDYTDSPPAKLQTPLKKTKYSPEKKPVSADKPIPPLLPVNKTIASKHQSSSHSKKNIQPADKKRIQQTERNTHANFKKLLKEISQCHRKALSHTSDAVVAANKVTDNSRKAEQYAKQAKQARRQMKKTKAARACQSAIGNCQKVKAQIAHAKMQMDSAATQIKDMDRKIEHAKQLAGDIGNSTEIAGLEKKNLQTKQQLAKATLAFHKAEEASFKAKKAAHSATITAKLMGIQIADKPKKKPAFKNKQNQIPGKGKKILKNAPKVIFAPARKSTPTGLLKPKKFVETKMTILGKWTQAMGGARADFLPGGYTQNTLVFRSDGVLEVHRTWGKDSVIKQVYRMSYCWKNDRKQLLLGEKPEDRPAKAARKAFYIPELGISAFAPVENFPVRLNCIRKGKNVIQLRNKTFKKE